MHSNHDPVTWKVALLAVCAFFVDVIMPWSLHTIGTLLSMLFCYFAFNYIKHKAYEAAELRPWIKKFLHRK